jgi:hypothetical protein
MQDKNVDNIISYFNDVMVRIEERIVVLTGRTGYARFGFEITGADYVRSMKIDGATADEMLDNCIKGITEAGIVKGITYSPSPIPKPEGDIEFIVSGCIHLPKEEKLMKDGVTPFICPLGNMLSTLLQENAKYEMGGIRGGGAAINLKKQECILKGLICENVDEALAKTQI